MFVLVCVRLLYVLHRNKCLQMYFYAYIFIILIKNQTISFRQQEKMRRTHVSVQFGIMCCMFSSTLSMRSLKHFLWCRLFSPELCPEVVSSVSTERRTSVWKGCGRKMWRGFGRHAPVNKTLKYKCSFKPKVVFSFERHRASVKLVLNGWWKVKELLKIHQIC